MVVHQVLLPKTDALITIKSKRLSSMVTQEAWKEFNENNDVHRLSALLPFRLR